VSSHAYLRHMLNQAIRTIDSGNVIPPGTMGTTRDRLIELSGERKAYLMVLSMLDAPTPSRFNDDVANDYGEQFLAGEIIDAPALGSGSEE
jgi:hypothetical protein